MLENLASINFPHHGGVPWTPLKRGLSQTQQLSNHRLSNHRFSNHRQPKASKIDRNEIQNCWGMKNRIIC
jgi:hypothetical protein